MEKIRWGILSTAKIGLQTVIPAMQQGEHCEITAISSRNLSRAKTAAQQLNIHKAYGSYAELLADAEIDAVYNPLPNHLHVPWSLKALEAGKHVLCEKPIAMNAKEAEQLLNAAQKKPHLKVMEAFMYRLHPQWQLVKRLTTDGSIGEFRVIQILFSFYLDDPSNIRNVPQYGGGGLLDIGCYCISLSRFLFDSEPKRVCSTIEYDPNLKVDRMASAIMEFKQGTSTFTCSTQLSLYQHVQILGTKGRIEIKIPFNPQPNEACKLELQRDGQIEELVVDPCNQYTIQVDLFSQAILNDTEVPIPLKDAVTNMKVIDEIFRSHEIGNWVTLNQEQ